MRILRLISQDCWRLILVSVFCFIIAIDYLLLKYSGIEAIKLPGAILIALVFFLGWIIIPCHPEERNWPHSSLDCYPDDLESGYSN